MLLTLPAQGRRPAEPYFCIPAASTRTRVCNELFDYLRALQEAAALVSSSGPDGQGRHPVPDHPT